MKKKFSKILSVVLIILMIMSIAPITASAAETIFYTNNDGEYICGIDEGKAYIYSFEGSGKNVKIPSYIGNYPVVCILEEAFMETDITSVTIPDSVLIIGERAFYNCKSLSEITIEYDCTYISKDAFTNTAYYNDNNNWENSVLYIGTHLIKNTSTVSDLTIKPGTTTIAENAFQYTSIRTIRMPSSLIVIGERAFANSSIRKVIMNTSVALIFDYAFYSCYGLTDVYYAGTENEWNDITILSNNSYLTEANIHYKSVLDSAITNDFKITETLLEAEKGTPVSKILNYALTDITIKAADGKVVDSSKNLGTGMQVIANDSTVVYTVYMMADIDGDGEIKAADARLALRASVGLDKLTDAQKKAADKDGDGAVKAADARIILRLSVGLPEVEPEKPAEPEPKPEPEKPTEPEPEKPTEPAKPVLTITAKQYDYLAGTDFRSVRRQYSSAKAEGAYVVAYLDTNGDECILTYVVYKIGSGRYSTTTLHNITKGTTIKNPNNYYSKLADRAYGASKSNYMRLANDALLYETNAIKCLSDSLKAGKTVGTGAYVNAYTLNL